MYVLTPHLLSFNLILIPHFFTISISNVLFFHLRFSVFFCMLAISSLSPRSGVWQSTAFGLRHCDKYDKIRRLGIGNACQIHCWAIIMQCPTKQFHEGKLYSLAFRYVNMYIDVCRSRDYDVLLYFSLYRRTVWSPV